MPVFAGAKVVVLMTGSVLLSFRYHPLAVAALKEEIPAVHRSWDAEEKCWTISRVYAAEGIAILRRYFDPVNVTDESEPVSPPPPPPPPPRYGPPTGPHAILHLLPTAPPSLVEAAWKCLAKLEHPDMKPEGERAAATRRMQAINAAFDQLRKGVR